MEIINGNLINKGQNTSQGGMYFNPHTLPFRQSWTKSGQFPSTFNQIPEPILDDEGNPLSTPSGYDFFEGMNVVGGTKRQGAHDSINRLILESTISNMTRGLDNFKFGEKVTSELPDIFEGNKYLEGMLNFFGNQGNVNTNFMEALVKSQLDDSNFEDLFRVNISGQLGKDKELDYNLRGSKGNVGLNLSKTF